MIKCCSFVKIEIDAGKGEITIIAATVSFGDDVLDMERGERRTTLRQMTVFANG